VRKLVGGCGNFPEARNFHGSTKGKKTSEGAVIADNKKFGLRKKSRKPCISSVILDFKSSKFYQIPDTFLKCHTIKLYSTKVNEFYTQFHTIKIKICIKYII
jgi:hypothetical protein